MYKNKKILGIIPARGGSKGLRRKNILLVAGKPLIAWTIEAARKSKYLDRVILSSEDPEIISVAKKSGCEVPFVRPKTLAGDKTTGIEPVLHAIKTLKESYDYVVLLQPTSPLRSSADIDGCIKQCISMNSSSCVTVTKPDKSPFWMFSLTRKGRLKPLLKAKRGIRRQDLPEVYALNGAVYVAESSRLLKARSFITYDTLAYEMPQERSLDIDTEADLIKMSAFLGAYAKK